MWVATFRFSRPPDPILGTGADICIAETVRRQLARPFGRSAATEAAVIRERFPRYVGLRAGKIETMRPLNEVVDELLKLIRNESSEGCFCLSVSDLHGHENDIRCGFL